MSNLSDQEKIMFIPNLIEQFRRGDISHDEMWRQINQELICQQYANFCISSEACECHHTSR